MSGTGGGQADDKSVLVPIEYLAADECRGIWQREVKAIEEIRRSVGTKSSPRILDVGCADGQFLQWLESSGVPGAKLYGIDFSKSRLDRARKAHPYEFKQCNLEEGIPYENSTFDLVYCGETIEHLYNPDGLLSECLRVLKPGGYLVLSTPNLQAWYNRALFLMGIQPLFYEVSTKSTRVGAGIIAPLKRQSTPVGHLRVFNRTGIVDLLRQEGFEIVRVRGAIFEAFPTALQKLDNIFTAIPSLASDLVVTGRKPG